MKRDRAESILARVASFAKLERKATDEVGWIMLAYGVSRAKAARMIEDAKKTVEGDANADH